MAETIILDPSEVATSRTQMDVTPWVDGDGIDWGDAEIAAYMADQARGSSPVDFRVPNRTVTMPLIVKTVGGTTFAVARKNIQAKAAMFQREGGWIKRVTASGSAVFADVVNATLKLGGGWGQAHRNYDPDASLVLEVQPDFYGAEVSLSDHTETTLPELVFTETGIQGDFPARCRVVVDDDSTNSQLGLVWAFRSRHYAAASTAATRYEAEALTPLDTATRAALGGASGGTVVTHSALSTNWTPVLGTNMGTTTFLTHTGTNRLFARYRTTSGTAVQLRSVYDVGDLTDPVENRSYRAQAGTAFYIADLGEVRLDPLPVGTHRWQGQIQARGEAGTENVSIDRLWVLNVDEGFGRLTSTATTAGALTPYVARDEFNQAAGTLTGKTLPVGGTWGGAGDADDFLVETTGLTAQRTAVSDASLTAGRVAFTATSYTDIVAQVDFKRSVAVVNNWCGLQVRSVSGSETSSYFRVVHNPQFNDVVTVEGYVGGVFQFRDSGSVPALAVDTWYTLRLTVDAAGRFRVWLFQRGSSPGVPNLEDQNSLLATGGSLATGKVGFYDVQTDATANTRNFDNFAAWAPTADAVVFASRSMQIATDGARRLDATGTAYGPLVPVGDLPRLPVAGLEGRTTEVFVKMSRGNFGQDPDVGIDDISALVHYRPCWLFVP